MRYFTKDRETFGVDIDKFESWDVHPLVDLIDDIPPGIIVRFVQGAMPAWCHTFFDDESNPSSIGVVGQLYDRPVNKLRAECMAFIMGWKARDECNGLDDNGSPSEPAG